MEFQGASHRQSDRFRFDPDPELYLETAFGLTILKSLSEKDLIHDVGYVRTGKTYSRKFAPKVSRAEYLAMQVMNELPDQELPEFLEFFQGKVG